MTSVLATPKKTFPSKNARKSKSLFVVKIQCLPYGFFEKQLWDYFSQFGIVVRARVARSKKTGNHKGWAYVGFENKDVAEIAAETMNGYLMFEKKLLCRLMASDKIPKCMLNGPRYVEAPIKKGQAKRDAIKRNQNTSDEHEQKLLKKRAAAQQKAADRLKTLGIDYDLGAEPSYTSEALVTAHKASENENTESSECEDESDSEVEEIEEVIVPVKKAKKVILARTPPTKRETRSDRAKMQTPAPVKEQKTVEEVKTPATKKSVPSTPAPKKESVTETPVAKTPARGRKSAVEVATPAPTKKETVATPARKTPARAVAVKKTPSRK